jgi:hypothetical protein
MRPVQTVGIDLPLRILVWQDAANNTWLSYNEPSWIAQRHGVAGAESRLIKWADLLSAITTKAFIDTQAATATTSSAIGVQVRRLELL